MTDTALDIYEKSRRHQLNHNEARRILTRVRWSETGRMTPHDTAPGLPSTDENINHLVRQLGRGGTVFVAPDRACRARVSHRRHLLCVVDPGQTADHATTVRRAVSLTVSETGSDTPGPLVEGGGHRRSEPGTGWISRRRTGSILARSPR